MSEAVENAERRDAENPYPGGGRSPEKLAALKAYRERDYENRRLFCRDLADEYAHDLPEEVQDKIFDRAWDSGHSSGYPQVAQDYEELAEFARFARNA